MKTLEQLLAKTVLDSNGCWLWQKCLNSDGYARCVWPGLKTNGKVHRIVYQLTHPDEDITNKVIRHSCDVCHCINPVHLLSGTAAQNMGDRNVRERNALNKLTSEQVREIRKLHSDCNMKQSALADMFNVNYRTISCVINRHTWKWVI